MEQKSQEHESKGQKKTKGEQERESETIEGAEAETKGAEKTKGVETIGAEGQVAAKEEDPGSPPPDLGCPLPNSLLVPFSRCR